MVDVILSVGMIVLFDVMGGKIAHRFGFKKDFGEVLGLLLLVLILLGYR